MSVKPSDHLFYVEFICELRVYKLKTESKVSKNRIYEMCSKVKGHIIISCFHRSVDLLFAVQENLRCFLTFNVNDSELDGGWLEGILYVLLHVTYLQYHKGTTAACCFIFILGQKLLTHFVWILLLNLCLDLVMDVKIFFAFSPAYLSMVNSVT